MPRATNCTTRSSVAFLVEVLVSIAGEIDEHLSEMSLSERARFEKKVHRLTTDTAPLPDFSGFHPVFQDHSGSVKTPEGDVRRAFYLSYDDANCEFLKLASKEIDDRLKNGPELVSANFVIPYPPGFPIMVPGQVITVETITFMRKLDVKEIHGYQAARGLKLIKPSVLAVKKGKLADI